MEAPGPKQAKGVSVGTRMMLDLKSSMLSKNAHKVCASKFYLVLMTSSIKTQKFCKGSNGIRSLAIICLLIEAI